jgi:hypothetical protein
LFLFSLRKCFSFCLASGLALILLKPCLALDQPPIGISQGVTLSSTVDLPQALTLTPAAAIAAPGTMQPVSGTALANSSGLAQGLKLTPPASGLASGLPLAVSGQPQALTATASSRAPAPVLLTSLLTGLEVKAGGQKIILAWEPYPSNDKISYNIYRSVTPLAAAGSAWAEPINPHPIIEEYFLDAPGTSRKPPEASTHYYYALVARDSRGNSSPAAFIDVLNVAELFPPSNVQALAGDKSVKLSWDPSFSGGEEGLDGYVVCRSQTAGQLGKPLRSDPLKNTQYTDQAELVNGQEYYYTLLALDHAGGRSKPSEQVSVMPFLAAGVPANITASGKTDDMIDVTWAPSSQGTFTVAGYNVYRGTDKTKLEGPINKNPVKEPHFTDSESNSSSKPLLGKTYFYCIKAVDEKGLEGEPSVLAAGACLAPLEIKNTGLLSTTIPGLPPDSSLTIMGKKSIDLGYTAVMPLNTQKDGPTDRYPSLTSGLTKGFNLNQALQVRLEGKVGKKITVDVDYDDTKTNQDQQKISIIYNGDPDEAIQEAAFGDILLDLPHTEFAGYNKNLFGAKLTVGVDRFKFYAIGAQTKGITVTEQFHGNTALRSLDIQDTDFVPFKYYYITKDWPNQVDHPDLGNYDGKTLHGLDPKKPLEIWVTDNNPVNTNTRTTIVYTPNLTDPSLPPNAHMVSFNMWNGGIDYTVDYNRGIITFNRSMDRNWNIAVAYWYINDQGVSVPVGFQADGKAISLDSTGMNLPVDGKTSNQAHLIQEDSTFLGAQGTWRMMLMNRYSLGYQNILDPQSDPDFVIRVYSTAGQIITTLPQPMDKYNADRYYKIDPTFGTIQFTHDYPFANNGAPLFGTSAYNFSNPSPDAYNPSINPRLGGVSANNGANNYRIHIEYKNTIATFQLKNMGVIKNSEIINKDGLKLQRNVDYYIDYDTGFLTFLNPASISTNSVISVTYEYMPFGGKYQTNIFGARAEYDLLDRKRLTLGGTFLYNASQTPQDVPDVRSAPTALSLFDSNLLLSLSPEDFGTWSLPLLGTFRLPLTLRVQAEGALSEYNANTYRMSGENGVAMIDGMEGADNVLSLPPDNNAWFPSSPPMEFSGQVGGEFDTRRSFIKQSSVNAFSRTATHDELQNSAYKKNMLQWHLNNLTDKTWDGFVYPVAASGTNLHEYRYLEISADSTGLVGGQAYLYVDVGIVSEDSNNNGRLNFEGDGLQLKSGEDVGIDQYVVSVDANQQKKYARDPSGGPWGSYSPHPEDYPDGKLQDYWGGSNGKMNSEDLDNNGQLDTTQSYYEYKIPITPGMFNLYKVPLTVLDNLNAKATGEQPPVADPNSQQFLAIVKHVRMWIQAAPGNVINGNLVFESVQFTGNKWQPRVAPGTVNMNGYPVTDVSANTLNATAISQETDNGYVPDTFFYIYDTTDSTKAQEEIKNERALKLEYCLDNHAVVDFQSGNTFPAFYIMRNIGSSGNFDYSGYQTLDFDVFKPGTTMPGEEIFLRLGTNETNYYEYRVKLDDAPLNSWHTFRVDLTPGKGVAHFDPNVVPSLNQVGMIMIGISNPNAVGKTETIWLNNLRLTDPQSREGKAYLLNTDAKFSDIFSVNTKFRDTSSDFLMIDETPHGKQHQTISTVQAAFTKISFLPINLSWNRTVNYTEAEHRADPAYSGNFSLPDLATETLTGDIAYSQLPGLNISLNAQHAYKTQDYINEATVINPFVNTREWNTSLNPMITYSLPDKLFNVPIGSTTLTGKWAYTDYKGLVDMDAVSRSAYAANLSANLWDKWKQSLDENYTYQGSYRPVNFLSVTPNFSYGQSRERGFLGLYRFYKDLDPTYSPDNIHYFSESYKITHANKAAGLNVGLMNLPVISPSLSYTARNNRDYVSDAMDISKDMVIQSNIMLSDILGWRQCPQFNFSHKYSETASFRNDVANADNMKGLDFNTQWMADPINYKTVNAKIDNQSYLNSKNMSEDLTTNIALIPNVNLTPRYNTSWNRSMNTPGNFSTTETTSAGSGLIWSNIPFFPWLTLQNLNLDYLYSQNRQLDTNGDVSSRKTGHTATASLPFRFSSDLTGNLKAGLDTSIRYDGLTQNLIYHINNYTGGFTLNYTLRMLDPIRLPNFWPFNGALVKIEQNLLLVNDMEMVLSRSNAEGVFGTDTSTDMYTNETTLNYSLWKNVVGNLKVTNQLFYDHVNINKDYWAISLKMGLTANF